MKHVTKRLKIKSDKNNMYTTTTQKHKTAYKQNIHNYPETLNSLQAELPNKKKNLQVTVMEGCTKHKRNFNVSKLTDIFYAWLVCVIVNKGYKKTTKFIISIFSNIFQIPF